MEDLQKKTILIIEDEQFIRELYQRILSKNGYNTLTADDGDSGLEVIKDSVDQNKIDLIILDIMMPRLNGIETLKRIKSNSNSAQIPVIILTNMGQDETIKQAFTLGAQGYIIKSNINPQDILTYIEKIVK